jgi:hypothetical protein
MDVDLDFPPRASARSEDRELSSEAILLEMPLRRTLEWAAKLPDDVLPSVLMCHYARVANVIAATWDDAASYRAYMQSLAEGGNLLRFTPDALDELLALQRYFDELNAGC